MDQLKRLAGSLTLTFVLAVSIFAGETNTPPTCEPGTTNSPPCTTGQPLSDDPPVLGETNTPPGSETIDLVDIGEAVWWALTLF